MTPEARARHDLLAAMFPLTHSKFCPCTKGGTGQ